MSTAILSSKGQITIPAAVRNGVGIETGDRVEFVEVAPGRYELVAATLPATALKGLYLSARLWARSPFLRIMADNDPA